MSKLQEERMHTLTIEYSPDLLWALQLTPEEFAEQARLLLAVKLYEMGKLSTGLAARLAGMSRTDFWYVLGKHGLSPLNIDPDELESDVANALRAIRRPSN